MDATRLIDPGFWLSPEPVAMGSPEVTKWCQSQRPLDHHVLFQTSGSSSAPKWIALSKQALLLSAATVNRHLGVTEESCWGLSLPLHHVGGFGVVARSYEAACHLVSFEGKWDAERFARWIPKEGVTHVSLVPTQVHDLVAGGWKSPDSLRAIVVGGGRMEEALGQAARDLGWPVLASYGMTETGSQIATQSLDLLDKPYQCAPLPLLDPWFAMTNEEGRLLVSGPALFSGTVRRMGSSWEWVPREGEWHPSGDRARVEGREITPLGRLDAVVKIFGELVDPEVIERELIALSFGRLRYGDLAIVAKPDARAGHVLVAVIPMATAADAVAEAMDRYARITPGFRRLSSAVRVEALPLSELGKIRRGALLELLS